MQLKLLPSPVMQLLLRETFPGREHGFAGGVGTGRSCSDAPWVGECWLPGEGAQNVWLRHDVQYCFWLKSSEVV